MRNAVRFLASAFLAFTMLPAHAQLGKLISPGPLARAHAQLEGAENCAKCHEQGRRVSAARCLACHKAVAARVAQKKGVHRNAGADCVPCHVEHAGRDAELRPLDRAHFDHRGETGFPLDGRHAPLACERCHKTRTFLDLRPQCASCHKDVHNGRLGTDCARCHSTSAPFREAAQQFDHARTAFPLEGAHRTVACVKCHAGGVYAGVRHASCTNCHQSPHKSAVGGDCQSCHTPASWKVATFDHARTGTPLLGRHKTAACNGCHVRPATAVRLKLQPCGACHKDPHRGAFAQDCGACHNENGFRGAAFDHTRTRFPLQGKHRVLACNQCHKKAGDFRGLDQQCASCHKDPHRAQLGTACAQCHTTESFRIARYQHPRFAEFFGGQHAAVACDRCHRGPVETRVYKNLSTDCVTCHRDVHNGQFPRCTDCHSIEAPKFAPSLFDHAKTTFPLTGKHASVACAQCHGRQTPSSVPVYRGTSAACASCHKDPHAAQLGTSCEQCHTTATFRVEQYKHRNPGQFFRGKHATAQCADCHKRVENVVRFTGIGTNCAACHDDPHAGTLGAQCQGCHNAAEAWRNASRAFHKAGLFPLEGRHLVTACADCHRDGVIKGTPTRCFDCHWIRRQDDRYQTRLGNECEECHRPTAWADVTWNHEARTTFALSGAHRTLACDQCHRGDFGTTLSDCSSCHASAYQSAREPNHVSAGFPLVCQLCHRPADASWHQARFSHDAFALAGTHATQTCGACHRNDVYAGTPRDCIGCHRADYDSSHDPAHAAAGFGTACENCHRYTDPLWSSATYDHGFWPLVGRHTTARCATCHAAGIYQGRATDCLSCHRADYERAANPNHVAAGFPTTCDTCHRIVDLSWDQGVFSHDTFALAGQHATAVCLACHANGVYQGTPRTCSGCHQNDYNNAHDPNHIAAGFNTTCDSCHKYIDASWQQAVFTHTSLVLAGAHLTPSCSACHKNDVYAGTSRLCASCHQSDYNAAQNPNHLAAGFPNSCDTCHKYADPTWHQAVFAHTTFALLGVHATQTCGTCHINNVYAGTPRNCAGCHLPVYNVTQNPNHISAGFPTTCDSCHKYTDANWQQAVFAHTTFALLGVHATQTCGTCHINNVYAGTPRNCAGCHLPVYNVTQNPNHISAGFPTTCDTCHKYTDANWQQAVFAHTSFALLGVHATQTCGTCHINNVYAGTPRNCAGCHLPVYNVTQNPNHISAGFPTTCDTCHKYTDANWQQAVFAHTTFALLGVHATQACGACHINNVYAGTPRNCAGCHLSAYNNTTEPNHASAGFPTTCDTCHKYTDANWQQGVFAHTSFPLAGVHATQPCAACHKNGVYAGTPRQCSGCHLADYNATTDPNHAAAGFPTTCDTCHKFSDATWRQAVFAHTTFPLAGVHKTQPCGACHKNGVYAGTPRTCVGCHLAAYNATTTPNHASAGFPTTCDSCHKFSDTSWQQGVFDHSTFRLLGVHATQPCAACHKNGVYAGTPRTCVGCHLTDYNNTRDPNHLAAGFPTTCDTCHKFSDSSWGQAVFNHTWFPIATGRHSGNPCSACHTTPSAFQLFSCITGCHSRGETDGHHNEVSGYRYDSAACYACHPQGRAE